MLAGSQQLCVNPSYPRVRLSHSAIHCCLVFLPVSLATFSLSSSPSVSLFSNSAETLQNLLSGSSPCSCSPCRLPLGTQKQAENSHHLLLLSQLLTMQISSLSSSALPSLSLPPSATVGEVLSHFLSFSSPSLALPLTPNSYLVSHFSTCFKTERDTERREQTDSERKMLLLGGSVRFISESIVCVHGLVLYECEVCMYNKHYMQKCTCAC